MEALGLGVCVCSFFVDECGRRWHLAGHGDANVIPLDCGRGCVCGGAVVGSCLFPSTIAIHSAHIDGLVGNASFVFNCVCTTLPIVA